MKKIFYPLGWATFAVLFSCTKPNGHSDMLGKRITIDTTLTSGTTYNLNLAPYGDDDDQATIRQQAASFTTSEITNSASGFSPVYHFSAVGDPKTPLNEQVILSITEGSRNGLQAHPSDSTLITINLKVQ